MKKIFRISTVPISLNVLLKGQLRYLNQYFDITSISGNGPDLDEVREREGVKTYAVEMQRQISPVKDLFSLVKLYFYFRREKPDIIHSITPKAGLLSMVAGKLAGVPIRIHTFTGLVFPYKTGMMQKILVAMDRLLCYCATDIYPEGNGVKNDLLKFKITDKPLKIIANGNVNGVDLEYFDPALFSESEKQMFKKNLGIKDDDYVFLFVGRLVRDKGINELIDAFTKLESQFQNTKLLLVGPFEEDLDPILPESKNNIENNPNIISVGFQKDVRLFFSIADCFVFPSYREGFPNVLLQAGAMGLFSIVTDISGSNEIVKEGRNGTIINVKNKAELCNAMKKIRLQDLNVNSSKMVYRTLIEQNYGQGYIWESIKNEYYYLLDK
ncbi:glycosyltransferase family 4 protein [Epilithonimonas sp. UC225_85]|uniref:glycosyltransferase family 4 protein n=1 Tax=Epilithonimonas sp. UC225_85 TaxID=3350167 RepID=UPI0036D3323F